MDSNQPLNAGMDNVLAYRLGRITNAAASAQDAGDYIDRGLILRRLLEEGGFLLIFKQTNVQQDIH